MILPRRPRRVRPGQRAVTVALYLNAALLGLIVVALFTRDGAASISLLPAARAEGPAMGGGGNLYLIPGQFSERTFGCYVMDTDAQTLCVYRFDGAATTLKLIAARNFRHDRRLGHLNTVPDPKEVEVMVETERGGRKGAGGRDGAAGDDAAPVAPSVAPKSTSNPN